MNPRPRPWRVEGSAIVDADGKGFLFGMTHEPAHLIVAAVNEYSAREDRKRRDQAPNCPRTDTAHGASPVRMIWTGDFYRCPLLPVCDVTYYPGVF